MVAENQIEFKTDPLHPECGVAESLGEVRGSVPGRPRNIQRIPSENRSRPRCYSSFLQGSIGAIRHARQSRSGTQLTSEGRYTGACRVLWLGCPDCPIVAVLKSDKQSVRVCGDFRMMVNPVSKFEQVPHTEGGGLIRNTQEGEDVQKAGSKPSLPPVAFGPKVEGVHGYQYSARPLPVHSVALWSLFGSESSKGWWRLCSKAFLESLCT